MPQRFSRGSPRPNGEIAMTVRPRRRRASSSAIHPPSELPARWAVSNPAASSSLSTTSASASTVGATVRQWR